MSSGRKLKITTWNVNGIRSLIKQYGDLEKQVVKWGSPDIICLQETKIDQAVINKDKNLLNIPGYNHYYSCHQAKKGYCGVVTYVKSDITVFGWTDSIGNKNVDEMGRIIVVDVGDFVLINVYVPNSGPTMDNLECKLNFYEGISNYCKQLEGREMIFAGDYNTMHKACDNCMQEKKGVVLNCIEPPARRWIDSFLESGYVDSYRRFWGNDHGYTWFGYDTRMRAQNTGLRLDYIFISENMYNKYFRKVEVDRFVPGSDHVPITLTLQY